MMNMFTWHSWALFSYSHKTQSAVWSLCVMVTDPCADQHLALLSVWCVGVCVCVCVCVRMHVHVCVCVCVL